jgi:N-methylhydantoinase B
MSGGIDPITLAVLAGRMEQIADEMDATLFRAAFNPIIAEAHDASHGLYHAATGDTLVQGKSGLPIFVGVMSFAVKAVIDKAAEAGDLADGDIYIFNDAHIGGTHLSDMRLVRPYFRDGELFCYLASVGHWHDVGGAVPGNYNPSATEAFQEAFVLPPVKLAREGRGAAGHHRHPAAQHPPAAIGDGRPERPVGRARSGGEAPGRIAR